MIQLRRRASVPSPLRGGSEGGSRNGSPCGYPPLQLSPARGERADRPRGGHMRMAVSSGRWLRIQFSNSREKTVIARIGIGGNLTAPPLPHHRTYGSVYGGSMN